MNPIQLLLFIFSLIFNQTDKGFTMDREVMWRSLDGNKFEHVQLTQNEKGILADGLLIHLDGDGSFRIRYQIQCDNAWRIQKVHLRRLDTSDQQLILLNDGEGHWTNKRGERIEAIDGARDIDIHYSPFTNTLAIRRLTLQQGESAKTMVVFIKVPDLSLEIARQQYTLDESNATGQLYKYENMTSRFKTELPVDNDGLLIEYPQYFERIWSR